ncbi:MAG: hypothetical protein P8Y40_01330 [Desulfobacterales bacterium]
MALTFNHLLNSLNELVLSNWFQDVIDRVEFESLHGKLIKAMEKQLGAELR